MVYEANKQTYTRLQPRKERDQDRTKLRLLQCFRACMRVSAVLCIEKEVKKTHGRTDWKAARRCSSLHASFTFEGVSRSCMIASRFLR
jgi:hypothetical protein